MFHVCLKRVYIPLLLVWTGLYVLLSQNWFIVLCKSGVPLLIFHLKDTSIVNMKYDSLLLLLKKKLEELLLISHWAGLMVMNSFRFYLLRKVLISPSFLKENVVG